MENHRYSQSEELAEAKSDVQGSGVSKISRFEESNRSRRRRDLAKKTKRSSGVIEPSVDFLLTNNRKRFSPGGFLSCEYMIKLADATGLSAVEASVIWTADGKGEEDIGVHFFERRNRATLAANTFDQPQRLSTVLPQSPLSYDGKILKVGWQVRVRLFFESGQDFIADEPFLLSLDEEPRRLVSGDEQ
jgi:hypothetical protein